MSEATDWRMHLKVSHPDIQEPQVLREARVLRMLDSWMAANESDLQDKTAQKIRKTINVRLLTIMDEVRDDATTPE